VATKFPFRRLTGNYLKFDYNGVILWKRKEDNPVGTRIIGYVPLELRYMGFLKLILISIGTF